MVTGCKGHRQVGGRGDGVGWPGRVGDTKGTVTACQGRDHAGMAGEHLRGKARQERGREVRKMRLKSQRATWCQGCRRLVCPERDETEILVENP